MENQLLWPQDIYGTEVRPGVTIACRIGGMLVRCKVLDTAQRKPRRLGHLGWSALVEVEPRVGARTAKGAFRIKSTQTNAIVIPDVAALEEEIRDRDASFDLRWNADMRGIKKWQAAGEGRELTWPDHGDLVAFLLEEISRLKKENNK